MRGEKKEAAAVLMCNWINRAGQDQTEGTLFCLVPQFYIWSSLGRLSQGGHLHPSAASSGPQGSISLFLYRLVMRVFKDYWKQ